MVKLFCSSQHDISFYMKLINGIITSRKSAAKFQQALTKYVDLMTVVCDSL